MLLYSKLISPSLSLFLSFPPPLSLPFNIINVRNVPVKLFEFTSKNGRLRLGVWVHLFASIGVTKTTLNSIQLEFIVGNTETEDGERAANSFCCAFKLWPGFDSPELRFGAVYTRPLGPIGWRCFAFLILLADRSRALLLFTVKRAIYLFRSKSDTT